MFTQSNSILTNTTSNQEWQLSPQKWQDIRRRLWFPENKFETEMYNREIIIETL